MDKPYAKITLSPSNKILKVEFSSLPILCITGKFVDRFGVGHNMYAQSDIPTCALEIFQAVIQQNETFSNYQLIGYDCVQNEGSKKTSLIIKKV